MAGFWGGREMRKEGCFGTLPNASLAVKRSPWPRFHISLLYIRDPATAGRRRRKRKRTQRLPEISKGGNMESMVEGGKNGLFS